MNATIRELETSGARSGTRTRTVVEPPEPKPGAGTTGALKTSVYVGAKCSEVRTLGRIGTSGPNCGTSGLGQSVGLNGRVGIQWLRGFGVVCATSIQAMWQGGVA